VDGRKAFSANRNSTMDPYRREQQHGVLQLGGHLADDVHSLGLEQPQLIDAHDVEGCHVGSPNLWASLR
jgi:hypothetical protein